MSYPQTDFNFSFTGGIGFLPHCIEMFCPGDDSFKNGDAISLPPRSLKNFGPGQDPYKITVKHFVIFPLFFVNSTTVPNNFIEGMGLGVSLSINLVSSPNVEKASSPIDKMVC